MYSSVIVCLVLTVLLVGFVAQILVNRPDFLAIFFKPSPPKIYTTSYVQPVGGSASGYT